MVEVALVKIPLLKLRLVPEIPVDEAKPKILFPYASTWNAVVVPAPFVDDAIINKGDVVPPELKTVSFANGVEVPMPMLPPESIRIRSVLLVPRIISVS